jgi:hypothetical protein
MVMTLIRAGSVKAPYSTSLFLEIWVSNRTDGKIHLSYPIICRLPLTKLNPPLNQVDHVGNLLLILNQHTLVLLRGPHGLQLPFDYRSVEDMEIDRSW